ncbi:helix-turn-helix transcriptional regulator [bacterium]|nr:helix-turn-helix transcriptional regulator [bacterium]MBP3847970.1 helix-turn-helix transcriptional regulator [bacterium]
MIHNLSRIENGKVCTSIIVIANIAKALNVTLDTLLPLD